MRLTRTVHGLFITKETGRKNIVHKLNDMTQQPNNCVFSRVFNTQYIKIITSGKEDANETGKLVCLSFNNSY